MNKPDNPGLPGKHLDYPALSMFQMVERAALKYPDEPAYDFYGRITTFRQFLKRIDDTARGFLHLGVRCGDRITLCLPNIPQALDSFYALNRIGAVANMIHPLSAPEEITWYLNFAESPLILTVDMFYEKVRSAADLADHPVRVAAVRLQDELPLHLSAAYILKAGRKYLKYPSGKDLLFTRMIREGVREKLPDAVYRPGRTAVILYSGGTTGKPKGICLTDLNFNACALQARECIDIEFRPGFSMLACMPLFHGFGLGINIHAILIHGVCCILMPTFTIRTYSDMLIRKKPNLIAGVPTIFDALLHAEALKNADLSHLLGVFCGGDTLPAELKKKVDRFLAGHHADIQIREGYGLTECVTASCLTPKNEYRENSIGLPFPDTVYDIVKPGTDISKNPGEEGEIVLKGPTLMLGYLNNPKETEKVLRKRSDGDIWLYTGDLGYMDEEGYVYFRQRMKRMIITNGYNVYPGIIENALDGMDCVSMSCVIGVPDSRRGQRVRAYIVPADNVPQTDETRQMILDELSRKIAAYALPKEIIFRSSLPKTLVGKVAWKILEEEAKGETLT